MARQLITIDQARAEIAAAVCPLDAEAAHISEALDRVLAQDVVAAGNVPPFPSSAMDGYALSLDRLGSGQRLEVVGESRAGLPWPHPLSSGQAVRISTGAAVPERAEAVVRQEDVQEVAPGWIALAAAPQPGENIRAAGEVMRAGQAVLPAGTRLGPGELAAAISAGAARVMVGRRPVACILSTGDELRDPGEPLGPGEIHNSNGSMLAGLAVRSGAKPAPSARLPDDPAATEAGLAAALDGGDLVIVAGGVSVGPHDHVKPALARLGVQERFWGVSLQPGKPTWFGTREKKLVFGLPGNPVSAAVTFALFVWPAIDGLQGAAPTRTRSGSALLGEPVKQNRQREQALRVRLEAREGTLVAIPNGPQGSHVITSLIGADALALIPAGRDVLQAGKVVALEPLPA